MLSGALISMLSITYSEPLRAIRLGLPLLTARRGTTQKLVAIERPVPCVIGQPEGNVIQYIGGLANPSAGALIARHGAVDVTARATPNSPLT